MRCRANTIGALASVAVGVSYQLLLHRITTATPLEPVAVLLTLLPFVAVAGWTMARDLGWMAALCVTLMLLLLLAAVTFSGSGTAFMLGLPHLTANLCLLWFFARTLQPGRTPLITALARRLTPGSLPAELEGYTRRVTGAWSLFFGAQLVISLGLYAFGSLQAWSFFINLLNGPLIALMFVAEYGYRLLRFRDIEHSPLLAGLQVFSPAVAKPGKGR